MCEHSQLFAHQPFAGRITLMQTVKFERFLMEETGGVTLDGQVL